MNHQFEMAAIFAQLGCDLHAVDSFGRYVILKSEKGE